MLLPLYAPSYGHHHSATLHLKACCCHFALQAVSAPVSDMMQQQLDLLTASLNPAQLLPSSCSAPGQLHPNPSMLQLLQQSAQQPGFCPPSEQLLQQPAQLFGFCPHSAQHLQPRGQDPQSESSVQSVLDRLTAALQSKQAMYPLQHMQPGQAPMQPMQPGQVLMQPMQPTLPSQPVQAAGDPLPGSVPLPSIPGLQHLPPLLTALASRQHRLGALSGHAAMPDFKQMGLPGPGGLQPQLTSLAFIQI